MQESKIVATKRLQDEGHWNEASLYREGIRETLRSEGMTRKEANRVAQAKDDVIAHVPAKGLVYGAPGCEHGWIETNKISLGATM
jgi:hypothetical protein